MVQVTSLSIVIFVCYGVFVAIIAAAVNRVLVHKLRMFTLRRLGTLDRADVIRANIQPGQWFGFRPVVKRQPDHALEELRRSVLKWLFILVGVAVLGVLGVIYIGARIVSS